MKYILSFLFGAACGVGGTLLWLHKDIKDELKAIKNDSELPFTCGDEKTQESSENATRSDNTASQGHSERGVSKKEQERTDYHKIVNAVKTGEKPNLTVPVLPREDIPEASYESEEESEEDKVTLLNEVPEGVVEIDMDTFENDKSNEKDYLVYYPGDHIMCTENGTIITNPAMLVGTNWEQFVGHYAARTAFVRNAKLVTDYEIYMEDGLYTDEYGPYDIGRED